MTPENIFPAHMRLHALIAFALCALVLSFQSLSYKPNVSAGDAYDYLFVAKELADTGVLTDGVAAQSAEHKQGMFFAPLYPALVASFLKIDPVFYETVACHMNPATRATCGHDMGSFQYVQTALAILSSFLLWLTAWVVTLDKTRTWLALLLSFLAQGYAYHTANIMTENLVFPLFTLTSLFSVIAWRKKKSLWWLITGLALGGLALVRPSFVYLFYSALPILFVLAAIHYKHLSLRALRWPFAFLIGYFLICTPWMMRNSMALGKFAISDGYAASILVQRLGFNEMTMPEWRASFIYGLPDFGDSLAKKLFPAEDYQRFDYDNPQGFYQIGRTSLREQTLEAAGGKDQHLSYLLKNYVFADIGHHVLTTLSLAWRGMWISKYWSLICIPLFFGVFIFALKKPWAEFLILSIPPWFMLGFHAFTSVNVIRYNLIMIPCLSIAAAVCFVGLYGIIRKRLTQKGHAGTR